MMMGSLVTWHIMGLQMDDQGGSGGQIWGVTHLGAPVSSPACCPACCH